MFSIYNIDHMEMLRRKNAVQPHAMKKFRNALFKKAQDWDDALVLLPEAARADFKEQVQFKCLELVERYDSVVDGASKLVFRTEDDHLIESVVLRPKTGRTSVCISSQVGCACRCGFCATGEMGFTRNLTADEILDQVLQANRLLRAEWRMIRNVVFMGMGEPLLNLEHLFKAIDFFCAVPFFHLSPSKITVSTVGIPEAMIQFSEKFPGVQLALSLHSARQEVRAKLMPMARKYPLDQQRAALERIAQHGKVMAEYLMLEKVNDGEEDLKALEDFLRGLPVHINIIPFNEYDGSSLRGTPRPERERFASRLKVAGFDTTLRYSLGADISAACGQLVKEKQTHNGVMHDL